MGFQARQREGMTSSLASVPAPSASDQPSPTVPLAPRGRQFSEGLLHLCVFSPRIPPHPASCGSPPHPPSPAAAERAAHLLRDSRQHLLHRQDQLSGSGPSPTPPPQLCPLSCYLSQRQSDKDLFVHFSVREAFISDRKVPK